MGSKATSISTEEANRIANVILRGDAVLVTGAGFSHAAQDKFGDPLPLGRSLAQSIWPIAFGDSAFDDESSLGEIFRIAQQRQGNALKAHLQNVFTVDRAHLPERYSQWLALPWHRIYTLNIDDLAEAVQAKKGSRRLQILSALTSTPGDLDNSATNLVHLNGKLEDYPRVTFDPPSYGRRTAEEDPWYPQFMNDTTMRPTLYIGTVLDEPPIWHYLSARGSKGSSSETRPKSWLFTKNLPIARRELLAGFNINLVEAFEEDVFTNVVSPFLPQMLEKTQAQRAVRGTKPNLVSVSDAIAASKDGTAEFLQGSEPHWGDVRSGYAVTFELDLDLEDKVKARSDGMVLLHGPAGSGKTTSLMRLAAVLAAQGNVVSWLVPESSGEFREIEAEVVAANSDYVFIDDVDRFATSASSLANRISSLGAVVVSGTRTHRLQALNLVENAQLQFIPTPPLSDSDASALVDALERGRRLGALLKLSSDQRIRTVTGRHDRQLLVTLIEATSGRKFHEKIAEECLELSAGFQRSIYGVATLAHAMENASLTRDDLMTAVGGASNDGLSDVRHLVTSRLLIEDTNGLRTRHRTIAESALTHFRHEGQLSKWYEMLLFMVAVKYDRNSQKSDRYKRLLVRFLNHKHLHDQLRGNADVRSVYGALEPVLDQEFHFWLQRGSYELDYGDLAWAETFLLHAEAIRADDKLFETAWCHLLMKMSLKNPFAMSALSLAEEGLARLGALLDVPASRTPHTYAVYIRYGSDWVRSGALSASDDISLREGIRDRIIEARIRFPANRVLRDAITEAERLVGRA